MNKRHPATRRHTRRALTVIVVAVAGLLIGYGAAEQAPGPERQEFAGERLLEQAAALRDANREQVAGDDVVTTSDSTPEVEPDTRCPSLEEWLIDHNAQWTAIFVTDSQGTDVDVSKVDESEADDATGVESSAGYDTDTGFAVEDCYYNTGDLPPMHELIEQLAALDADLTLWTERIEAERIEAERIEAERRSSERRTSTPRRTAPAPTSGTVAEPEIDLDAARRLLEEYENQDPPVWDDGQECAMNCTPGLDLGIPPMPAECNGNAGYDTLWGGWKCLGD